MTHDVLELVREGLADSQVKNPRQNAMLRERHEKKVARLSPEARQQYDAAIGAMRASLAASNASAPAATLLPANFDELKFKDQMRILRQGL